MIKILMKPTTGTRGQIACLLAKPKLLKGKNT